MIGKIILTINLLSGSIQNTIKYDYVESYEVANEYISDTIEGFTRIGGISTTKVLDSEFGYIYATMETLKAPFTEKSNLFIARTELQFVPGIVAKENGNESYDKSYLYKGSMHMYVTQYRNDIYHGGKLQVLDYWPKSTSFTTTITSTLGYSLTHIDEYSAGFDLGNGASIKSNSSNSLTLSFNISKSTVLNDPFLSVQRDPNTMDKIQWNFEVKGDQWTVGKTTYYLDTYILFEIDNLTRNATDDAHTKIAYFNLQTRHNFWGIWYKDDIISTEKYIRCFW